MFTDNPPPKGFAPGVFEGAAAPNVNPPLLDCGAAAAADEAPNTKPPVDALVVAGVEDAPNVNGRSAGFESFSASVVAPDEAAPNAGVVVAAPKLNPPLADLGASALASATGAAPKVNGFGSSLAVLSSSFDVDAPKVKGFGAEDCSPLVASSVVVAPPNEKAGADADRVDF